MMFNIDGDEVSDAIDILSSLHNLLWEYVFGTRYNYAFHWANKCGSDTLDDVFDDILKGDAEHGTLEGNDRGAAAYQAGD